MAVIRIRVTGLREARAKIAALGAFDRAELMDMLGAIGVRQTRRRLRSEKTAPSGAAWPKNRKGTSTLVASGALLDSVHHIASATSARWGSNKIYARIHNEGGIIKPKAKKVLAWRDGNGFVFARQVTMPKRQFIGISSANAREIEKAALDKIGGMLK
jgi:phage gpG-like protein